MTPVIIGESRAGPFLREVRVLYCKKHRRLMVVTKKFFHLRMKAEIGVKDGIK
jgi:hypothetical protein